MNIRVLQSFDLCYLKKKLPCEEDLTNALNPFMDSQAYVDLFGAAQNELCHSRL